MSHLLVSIVLATTVTRVTTFLATETAQADSLAGSCYRCLDCFDARCNDHRSL
jgi:hypothetical protein